MGKVKEDNLVNRITAKEMLMDNFAFAEGSFNVIWSEGAIYNIGFEKGLSLWRQYLKKCDYADEVKDFVEQGKIEADMYNK